MKTIKQATDEIIALKTLGIGSIEPSVSETIRDVALEHYRAGMEQAAKMCQEAGTTFEVLGSNIFVAAKTAQLP